MACAPLPNRVVAGGAPLPAGPDCVLAVGRGKESAARDLRKKIMLATR